MDQILDKIKKFADEAHGEQIRKYSGERYIVHPVRVMELCKEYTQDIRVLAAALLHDVLEDTPVTKGSIRQFLTTVMNEADASQTLRFVVALTDVYTKKKFPDLNRARRRAKESERLGKTSEEAQTIKYADIIDNAIDITDNDPDFATVYLKESKNLLQRMTKGKKELHERALKTVAECQTKLK